MKRFKRLYIEITNVCNLSCSFCPQTKRAPRFLTADEFEHILREAQPCSDHVYLHVKGEPLLHPDLPAILDLCAQYGFAANIITNGTLLADRLDELLGKKALRQVNVSLHSAHDNELSLRTYLKGVIESVKRIRQTHTTATLRLWNMDGDDATDLQRSRNRVILDAIEQAFSVEHIEDRLHGNRGLQLGQRFYLNHGTVFDWPAPDAPVISDRGFCFALRSQLAILVDGTVVPCCLDAEGVIALGNVFSQSLGEIIASPRAVNLIDGFTHRSCQEELCKRCGYRDRFGGEFRSHNRPETKEMK